MDAGLAADVQATDVPAPRTAPELSRFLVDVARRVGGSLELKRTLDQVVAAVVDLLGFQVAVLNLATVDGTLEVVSVAGPQETREQLLGSKLGMEGWLRLLAAGRLVGSLCFLDRQHTDAMHELLSWVPDLDVSYSDSGAWHPLDALFAPLYGPNGDLLGVLSVDSPLDGRQPDARQCELLELFAVQASLALDNTRVHAQLERSEQVFRATFEDAPVGMAVFGPDRRISKVNRAYCTFLGRTAAELVGQTAAWVSHPEDRRSTDELSAAVRQQTGLVYKIDKRYSHSDGSTVWGRLSLTRLDGGAGLDQVLAQVEDITAERTAREELLLRARTDPLTGLLDRAALLEELAAALASGSAVAVLFADIDHFKAVNDTLGHAAGDRLLIDIAGYLRDALRPGDCAGRLGGDEFVLVLRELPDAVSALAVAERVRTASSQMLGSDGPRVATTLSVGVTVAGPGQPADEVLAAADRALYAAKQAGRDCSRLG